jgi:PKD repeat protein
VLSAFTFSPAAPKQFEPVTFDASGATLEGSLCGSRCVFTWTFGSEGSDAGEVVTHRFESPGTHVVTLVITGPDNVTTTLRKSVTVAEGVPPVAKFVVSPTDPIPGQTVFFTAAESAGKGGAHIVSYAWDFGNGSTGEGVSSSTTYSADGSYAVVLTVTDSNGLTTATSLTVSVKSPAAP